MSNHKPHYKYLSETEYQNLLKYKHHAPKTPYEIWLNKGTAMLEEIIPPIFSANTFTIVGNTAMYVAAFVAIK